MKSINKMKIKLLFAALFTLVLFTAAPAQTLDKAKLDQFFDRLAEKNKAMGSLTISKDGKAVYTRVIGYGQISGTEKKPLTAASRFRIGSITKMFTAALVLQLVEDKKLKLTDTLDKFFPQIPNAQKITIAQILGHRSGIHDSLIDPKLRTVSRTEPITKEQLLALIAKGKPDFEPDAKNSYSNSGYAILGLIIEKITGKPYEEALRKRVISKIGLKDTYLATGNIDPAKNEALTYMNLGAEWKPVEETHPSNLFSAGGLVSTPNDLAIFIQALFEEKLVSTESLNLMKTMKDGDGIGMETFNFAGKTFYGYTGGADNYGAWLAYLPGEKVALAYTTNAKVYPVKDIVSGVMDIYYGKPFQIPTFESLAIGAEVLDKYVGVYSTADAPVKFTITREGTTLYAQPPGQSTAVPLEATAIDKFKIDNGTATGIVIEFDTAKNQMTIKRGGGQRVFTKDK
jgi:CubicO group peptidase (beta-lactamase class C family)